MREKRIKALASDSYSFEPSDPDPAAVPRRPT